MPELPEDIALLIRKLSKKPRSLETQEVVLALYSWREMGEEEIAFYLQFVMKRLVNAPNQKVSFLDGVGVSNDDGWWLLRASHTQDVLSAGASPNLRRV